MSSGRPGATGWQFWIDRGGTFTDVVARRPDGELATAKFLSENPRRYDDAAIAGIAHFLGVEPDAPIPHESVDAVRMGTTVATNALLARAGDRTVFVTTAGFGDILRIGTQARPDLFALDVVVPDLLHEVAVEVDERIGADGTVLRPLDVDAVRRDLVAVHATGVRSIGIALLHGYRHTAHERIVAEMGRPLRAAAHQGQHLAVGQRLGRRNQPAGRRRQSARQPPPRIGR